MNQPSVIRPLFAAAAVVLAVPAALALMLLTLHLLPSSYECTRTQEPGKPFCKLSD